MSDKIIYQNSLPEKFVSDATRLYAEAFERKFLKIIGDKDEISKLFGNNVNLNRAIAAFTEDTLLGIAGLHFDGKPFLDVQLENFHERFGYVKGSIKAIISDILFSRKPAKDELLMDGIVVSKESRGKGIGSKLFAKILEFAKEKDFKQIRLDVIDENPRAKKLYESLGFETIKYENTNYLKDLIGVSGVSTMIKKVE